ncbi:MAG: hypothetical protein Q8J69_04065 [Sphingobacteriaceae bacterium]|nr:hypothetical protein [Sphingobacteriaceae bacterium]
MDEDELYETLESEIGNLISNLIDDSEQFKIRGHAFVIEVGYEMSRRRANIETYELVRSKEIYNQFHKKPVTKAFMYGRIEESGQVRFDWVNSSEQNGLVPSAFISEENKVRYMLEITKYIKS